METETYQTRSAPADGTATALAAFSLVARQWNLEMPFDFTRGVSRINSTHRILFSPVHARKPAGESGHRSGEFVRVDERARRHCHRVVASRRHGLFQSQRLV